MHRLNRYRISFGFAIALAILLSVGLLCFSSLGRFGSAAEWRSRTNQIRYLLTGLLSSVMDSESAERGFLITGDEAYLRSYQTARRLTDGTLESLRAILQKATREEQQPFAEIEASIAARVETMEDTVALYRRAGGRAAREAVRKNYGREMMDHIRLAVRQLDDLEAQKLSQWDEEFFEAESRAKRVLGLGSLIAALITLLASVLVLRDIAGRREAEAEVQRMNEQLKENIAQLEAANQELEAFSYSVSHDLRTPLRAIDGFSQSLLEDYRDGLDDRGKDYLDRVRAASQRMGKLIDEMLGLSRVTRKEIKRERVDLTLLAREIVEELKRSSPQREVEFRISDGLTAYGDAQLLRAVLENLLGNAWKFTRRCPFAQIEFGRTGEPGASEFFVRDNGAGFDMAYASKLFGIFQRMHTTREFEGTGVGLATVQRVIHKHGGNIRAAAEVGRGATFYFNL